MKTRLIIVSLTGLFLVVVTQTIPVQTQPAEAPLVTIIATNAPAVPIEPARPAFVLPSLGIIKEVEKLAQAGTDPAVIRTFIQSWSTPYSVSADDIVHLHEMGVTPDILTILIQHGTELNSQAPATEDTGVAASSDVAVPYPGFTPPVAQPSSPPPPVPNQYVPQPAYPVDQGGANNPDYPVYDSSSGYATPPVYPVVVIGGGIAVRGHHDFHGEHGEHGDSYSWHSGNSDGHAGSSSGHGGGSGDHGGSSGAHGGGSGGHEGGSGGHSGSGGHGGASGGHSAGSSGHEGSGHR